MVGRWDHIDCVFDGSSKHVDFFGQDEDMVCDIGEIDSCCGRDFCPSRFIIVLNRWSGWERRRHRWGLPSASTVLTKVSRSFWRRTVISERVDHVIQRVESSFQNVEFSGYNMKFSSMLHLG